MSVSARMNIANAKLNLNFACRGSPPPAIFLRPNHASDFVMTTDL